MLGNTGFRPSGIKRGVSVGSRPDHSAVSASTNRASPGILPSPHAKARLAPLVSLAWLPRKPRSEEGPNPLTRNGQGLSGWFLLASAHDIVIRPFSSSSHCKTMSDIADDSDGEHRRKRIRQACLNCRYGLFSLVTTMPTCLTGQDEGSRWMLST